MKHPCAQIFKVCYACQAACLTCSALSAAARCAFRYAEKVSGGHRPACPKRMPPGVWSLIEACWQQQPGQRPAMASVVGRLQQLIDEERASSSAGRSNAGAGPNSSKSETSTKVARDGPSSQEASAATPAAAAREVQGAGVSATCGCCIC
jgi:hypothetical protein